MTEKRILIRPDPDLAEEAVWYRTKLIEYLHAGREALNTRDIQTLSNIGHRIKGSAESFGFDLAGKMGTTLETDAKNNDLEGIGQVLNLLSDYLDNIEIVSD
jgi:HPt (histidine-containing phosphotransfer) domain-containing protein